MTVAVHNARVLVVGASGGIGGAVADALVAGGAEVVGPGHTELDIADSVSVDA